jgi:ribosome biogenesis protein Tsr3
MRFTEHELTAALTGAAKAVVTAQRKDVRKGAVDIDTAWEAMSRLERFQVLDALGDQILPVLVALPDVEVAPGTRPTFSEQQVSETVAASVGDVGRLRRAVVVKARTALVQTALAHVPPRLDPDALLHAEEPG